MTSKWGTHGGLEGLLLVEQAGLEKEEWNLFWGTREAHGSQEARIRESSMTF